MNNLSLDLLNENKALKETIKGYQSVIDIANASNATQQRCIENLKETIKGLDRATVEYTRIIAEKDERISTLLEAQASVPTRDVNGTIEALHGLVAKLKGDVLKLQAKVTEQEDTIALLKPRPVALSQPVAGTSGSEVVDILTNAIDSRSHEQTK